jgi:hypothetical protein
MTGRDIFSSGADDRFRQYRVYWLVGSGGKAWRKKNRSAAAQGFQDRSNVFLFFAPRCRALAKKPYNYTITPPAVSIGLSI